MAVNALEDGSFHRNGLLGVAGVDLHIGLSEDALGGDGEGGVLVQDLPRRLIEPDGDPHIDGPGGLLVLHAAEVVDASDEAGGDAGDSNGRAGLEAGSVVEVDIDGEALLEGEVTEDEHEGDKNAHRRQDERSHLEFDIGLVGSHRV